MEECNRREAGMKRRIDLKEQEGGLQLEKIFTDDDVVGNGDGKTED